MSHRGKQNIKNIKLRYLKFNTPEIILIIILVTIDLIDFIEAFRKPLLLFSSQITQRTVSLTNSTNNISLSGIRAFIYQISKIELQSKHKSL